MILCVEITGCQWLCVLHVCLSVDCTAVYQVQKLPVNGDGDWTPVNAKPIAGTEFTVPDLVDGSQVEFRVVTVNCDAAGKPSNSTGPHVVRDPVCELLTSQIYVFVPWAARNGEIMYHRRRSCTSPVLTAISLVNGKPWEPAIFDPPQNRQTLTDR